MSDYIYHQDSSRISASMIKLAHSKSLRHVYKQYIQQQKEEASLALRFGTMFHALILEPELFEKQFEIVPKGTGRNSNAGKALLEKIESEGKTVVRQQDYDEAMPMKADLIAELRDNNIDINKGIWEKPVIFKDTKCKPDVLIIEGDKYQIIDLKTCADIKPYAFWNAAYKQGYHTQAAWYTEVVSNAYNVPKENIEFIFAAVEKSSHLAHIYRPSVMFMERGQQVIEEVVPLLRQAMAQNVWPKYFTGIGIVDLPDWAVYDTFNFDNEENEGE